MRKSITGLLGVALSLVLIAACDGSTAGTVVSNGRNEAACNVDSNKPIAVGVQIAKTSKNDDGSVTPITEIVCLSESEASAYPLGSHYPKK